MSEKLFDDAEFYLERFQCDCLSPEHCLDVHLELADNGSRIVECGFDITIRGNMPLWLRIKWALKYIIGKELSRLDYIWRDQDIPRIIAVLKRAINE